MASREPLVSILLPVRDGAAHLEEALDSLQVQTLEDFEIIVVDDGSTDATPDILEAWGTRDERIRVVSQPAEGIVAALERARALARAPYLARMDADDISEPTRLAAQLALMEAEPTLAACGCGIAYFHAERVRDGAVRYQEWINATVTPDEISRDLFVECPLAHPTFFLRAHTVDAVGGYRDCGWPEDYDLVLRLWSGGGRLGKVAEPLLRWREGPGRLSRTDPRYRPDAFLACKVDHLRRTLLQGRTGVVVWGAGPVGKAAARAFQAAGVTVRAFVELDPRKIGQEIHGAPVLALQEGVRIGPDIGPDKGVGGSPSEAAEAAWPLHLAAVGQPGARRRIRTTLQEAGLRELEDFVAIA
jgi:hypothetical protein